VVWFICAAMEATMYWGFPQLFGDRRMIVFSHAVVLVLYAGFRLLIARQKSDTHR